MNITYDPNVDINSDGKLVGIEILDASKRVDNPYVMTYSIAQTIAPQS